MTGFYGHITKIAHLPVTEAWRADSQHCILQNEPVFTYQN
ncbi:hypothetical protein LRU_00856 [Ligilactobacillus ruminis SPM0211]|uniref:Uncharacterized protein n=1 Tax=Ligilactobacillus ruminis SPM0211 TaxID=1040964 RepID=F7QZK0_9LACO|nr:hypothetical protein LRU_00856 [Ligilactobacillus ruminis SPM0211]